MIRYPSGVDTLPLTVINDRAWFIRLVQLIMLPIIIFDLGLGLTIDLPAQVTTIMAGVPISIIIIGEAVFRVMGPRWRKVYTLDSSMVVCETADGTWTEAIDHYQSVYWYTETRRSGKNRNTYQVVELRHGSDHERNVRLVDTTRRGDVRRKWESFARAVHLPATKDLGGGKILRREPEDLDLSIRQLVEKGSLIDDFDPDRAVPAGIRWHQRDGRLVAKVRRASLFYLFIIVVVLILGVFVAITTEGDLMAVTFAACVLLVVVAVALLHSHHLEIAGSDLRLSGRLLGVPYWFSRQIPLDRIEGVYARHPTGLLSMLVIESDERAMGLGPVTAGAGQWLEKFLITAIANAPRTEGTD